MIEPQHYRDLEGKEVWVAPGLGGVWISVRGHHRVKSPALPARESREEAQADLDAYAKKQSWERLT